MNKLTIIIFICALQSCTSPKTITSLNSKPPYDIIASYKATLGNDEYILGLFPHNTYIYGKNRGEMISLGHYEENNGVLSFSSFIQSFDKIPMIVKESFVPKLDSSIVKLSMVSGMAFLGDWIGFSARFIEVDGQDFSDGLPTTAIDFDSIYTVKYRTNTTNQPTEILLKGRTLHNNVYYQIKDSTSNYFELYYLHFRSNQFSIFEDSKVQLDTNTLKISVALLDTTIEDETLMIEFKKLSKSPAIIGMYANSEGATFSAYRYFVAGGRLELIKK